MKFSKDKIVIDEYKKIEEGKVFSALDFSVHINDKKLQWILRDYIKNSDSLILFPKVYYKTKKNRMIPNRILTPDIQNTLKVLSRRTGEMFQEHGGISANYLGLSTQVPQIEVFYTNRNSREFLFFDCTVRLIKTRCLDVFQYPHEKVGWAVSALYFLGPKVVDVKMINKLKESLGEEDFQTFLRAKKPSWINKLIDEYS